MSETSLAKPNAVNVGSEVSPSSTVAGGLSTKSTSDIISNRDHKVAEIDDSNTANLHTADAQSLRLDLQHHALRLTLDSPFPSQDRVLAVLGQNASDPPQVMDVGTGSGRWAIEMATAYPQTKVIGVDLVPPTLVPKEKIPPNCRFEIHDANLAMDHYSNTFSLVHARFMSGGLTDADSFFYNFAKVLKPGGIFINATADHQLLDEALQPLPFVEPGEPGFTWLQYTTSHINWAQWRNGCPSHQSKHWWKEWLEANPNYSEVYVECFDVPVGTWRSGLGDKKALAAQLFQDNLISVIPSWRRLLLESGVSDVKVTRWLEETQKELKEMRVHAYLRFRYFIAVRSAAPWIGRDSAPVVDLTSRQAIKGLDLKKSWEETLPTL